LFKINKSRKKEPIFDRSHWLEKADKVFGEPKIFVRITCPAPLSRKATHLSHSRALYGFACSPENSLPSGRCQCVGFLIGGLQRILRPASKSGRRPRAAAPPRAVLFGAEETFIAVA
jgi:hypothetical protein